jgi:hypothetical protein
MSRGGVHPCFVCWLAGFRVGDLGTRGRCGATAIWNPASATVEESKVNTAEGVIRCREEVAVCNGAY